MSYPAYPPPRKPLPANVATPKASARRKNVGLLVAILLVLIFGTSLIGLALFTRHLKAAKDAQKIDKAMLKVADQFLRDMEKARYNSAVKRVLTRSENDTSADDLRDLMADVKKRRGKAVGHTGPEWWNVGTNGDWPTVRLVYKERYESGASAPVVLHVDWQDYQKRWNVAIVDYQ